MKGGESYRKGTTSGSEFLVMLRLKFGFVRFFLSSSLLVRAAWTSPTTGHVLDPRLRERRLGVPIPSGACMPSGYFYHAVCFAGFGLVDAIS